jgi:hypothetical protein
LGERLDGKDWIDLIADVSEPSNPTFVSAQTAFGAVVILRYCAPQLRGKNDPNFDTFAADDNRNE